MTRYFHSTTIKCTDKTKHGGRLHLLLALFVCLQGSDVDDEDTNELMNDTRLLKKLKKGQISEEDFEKQITRGGKHKSDRPSHDSSDENV